jgi:hypothetical protein
VSGIEILPDGALYPLHSIACSRHSTGENDPRVKFFLGCIVGQIFHLEGEEKAAEFANFIRGILRLHDHKGALFIVSKQQIPEWIEELFDQFWRLLDPWQGHQIEPRTPDDEVWEDIWRQRRFESDWTPEAPH